MIGSATPPAEEAAKPITIPQPSSSIANARPGTLMISLLKKREKHSAPIADISKKIRFVTSKDNTSRIKIKRDIETKKVKKNIFFRNCKKFTLTVKKSILVDKNKPVQLTGNYFDMVTNKNYNPETPKVFS